MSLPSSKLVLAAFTAGVALSAGGTLASVGTERTLHLLEDYGKLPLYFQPNRGQTDPQVTFLARDRGYTLFLTPAEAVLVLRRSLPPGRPLSSPEPDADVVRMQFVGGAASEIVGLEELPGKVNYFRGADPARWRRNDPTYKRVAYRRIYPGIDVVFHGDQRQ